MSTTVIKERPILFSGEMVRAILDGRKTQTRRIIKGSTEHRGPYNPAYIESHKRSDGWARICPYGQPGDRLWVRETFSYELARSLGPACRIAYKASWCNGDVPGWKPSIHMPRWASRITLEITGVRVERLKDISEEDAIAEGWPGTSEMPWSPRCWFQSLWQSINGEDSWEANPWVWVIEFKRTDAAQTSAVGGK